MVSAIMQSVSGDRLAIALATGGRHLLHLRLPDHRGLRPPWCARVKSYKAGFVISDSNLTPDMTLADVLEL